MSIPRSAANLEAFLAEVKPVLPHRLIRRESPQSTPRKRIHSHPCFEVGYILHGSLRIMAGGNDLTAQVGTLFITAPGVEHFEPRLPGQEPPVVSYLGFKARGLPGCHRPFTVYQGKATAPLRSIFSAIQTEVANRQPGWEDMVHAEATKVLVHLYRLAQAPAAPQTSAQKEWQEHLVDRWTQYVDTHCHQPGFKVGEGTTVGPITLRHFQDLFKARMGMTCKDYVDRVRMDRARALLETKADSIAEIAQKCGFKTTPHFSRRFSALTGTTPAKYRFSTRREMIQNPVEPAAG